MTPLQSFGGQDLYPSLIDKAVRLAFGLIKNHPFIDGNKRIGTHAMLVFLALNGVELSYTDNEMIAIILSVAAGQVDESGLRAWIDEHLL
ncbi:death-on-curing family protein [Actinotignum schaalii FB123-CNA-2]|uniref:Death-on-curing family protein n=1 Tax=Actinotignum schaalii FB123-CNA-2 TaxID=883067 RepID=S2VPJ7_9ACTO|nr:death-on-curing family protein [Actinotignum schaalii FB123-CNA-2]